MPVLMQGNNPIGIVDKEGGSGGGHVIIDPSGESMTQQPNMQFVDAHTSDDSTNAKTIIENIKSATEAEFESATEDGLYDVDVEGAEIGEISEDYVEVTADGTKTYRQLLDELYSHIDLDKVNAQNTVIVIEQSWGKEIFILRAILDNGTLAFFNSSLAVSSPWVYVSELGVKASNSTYIESNTGASTNHNSDVPTSGSKITLYYGNDKAVVDLQTTANRCLLSDGRNVQQAVASNNLDNGINISTYTSASPYIFPSDGYITLSISGGTYANGYLKGSASGEIWIDMHEAKQVVHVRKGMKAYFTSGNGTPVAYFIPFS